MIDPSLTGLTHLSDQLPRGILLGKQEGMLSDFLVFDTPTGKVAVALDNPGAMLGGAPLGPFVYVNLRSVISSWRGSFVPDVRLEVDPRSWFTSFVRHPRPGEVAVQGAKVFVTARHQQPFGPRFQLLEWGGAANLGHGAIDGGFSRWQIVSPSADNAVLRSFEAPAEEEAV